MYVYMYGYMHMFGLREPMVLSALKCLGLAGPVKLAASKICSAGHAANPKVPMVFGSQLLRLSRAAWLTLSGSSCPYSKDQTDWIGRKPSDP